MGRTQKAIESEAMGQTEDAAIRRARALYERTGAVEIDGNFYSSEPLGFVRSVTRVGPGERADGQAGHWVRASVWVPD